MEKFFKFVEKNETWVAILICVVFFFVSLFSVAGFNWLDQKTSGDAPTSDEVSHITDGYYYFQTGRYFINPEHPPLTKDLSALPLLILNPEFPEIMGEYGNPETKGEPKFPYEEDVYLELDDEMNNGQWELGRIFMYHPNNDPDVITFWSRFSVIFFNSLLLFLLFLSLKKTWNAKAGLLSIILIAVSPFMMAHASLVTLDFMPSMLQMLAFCWLAIFLKNWLGKKKFIMAFILTVLCFSAAMLSKFSFAMFLPVAMGVGLIVVLFRKNKWKDILTYIGFMALLGALVILIIGLFYSPHVINMSAEDMVTQVNNTYPSEGLPEFGKDIMNGLAETNFIFFKGLVEYGVGVVMVLTRIADAWQTIYFMGGVYGSEGAGLLYFPVLFFTKLTIPFLLLFLFTCGLAILNLFKKKDKLIKKISNYLENPLAFFLLSAVGVYGLITAFSSFQIGLRHIMPMILAIALLMAKQLYNYWKHNYVRYGFVIAVIFMLGSCIWAFPHYLEYYNILGGGTSNGYKIATDSNYDWAGQDLRRLGNWMEDNNVDTIYTDIFTNVPIQYYTGDDQKEYRIGWDWTPPKGAYIAVSANRLQNNIYSDDIPEDQKYSLWDDYLVDRVGETIFIYQIPE